jgi:hypothetical protein
VGICGPDRPLRRPDHQPSGCAGLCDPRVTALGSPSLPAPGASPLGTVPHYNTPARAHRSTLAHYSGPGYTEVCPRLAGCALRVLLLGLSGAQWGPLPVKAGAL